METALLPREVVFSILKWNIRMVSIFEGLSHRLICREVNEEVLNILLCEGLMDERLLPAQNTCRTCHTNVRPEQASRAINETTVRRYIKNLLERNNLPKWDLRYQDLDIIKRAISTLRQELQPRQSSYTDLFTRAVTTLLGVRTAWSYLGPHHATCLDHAVTRLLASRPIQFWVLVCATFANDQKLVQKCLLELAPPRPLDGRYHVHGNSSSSSPAASVRPSHLSIKPIYAESLAASLTVAIRRGNGDLLEFLFSVEHGLSKPVLLDIAYFNRLSVLNVAIMTTESSNPAITAVAARTVSHLLQLKVGVSQNNSSRQDYCARMRALTHIPLASGVLEDALKLFFRRQKDFYSGMVSVHILCRAALTNDIKLTITMVNLVKATMKPTSPHYLPNPGSDSAAFLPATAWADEYGVRQDRLLDCARPIRIALACSSLEVLEYLLTIWPSLRDHMRIKEETGIESWDSIENYRKCYKPRGVDENPFTRSFDMRSRLRAVRDVFIEPDERLQHHRHRKPASVLGLEILFKHTTATSDCWGAATVHAARVTDPAIFKAFINHVDIHKALPYGVSGTKEPFYLADDSSRTVGERALRRAYQLGRIENVRLLLAAGIRPASDLRGPMYFEDDIDAVVNALKMRHVLREYGLVGAERTVKVPYLLLNGVSGEDPANGDENQKMMENVHFDTDTHRWRFGRKTRLKNKYTKLLWPNGKGGESLGKTV